MRQAGRYHHHYRRLRQRYSFTTLCKEPELAAQAALGPVEDFDFDVAILFSDILFILEAFGLTLAFRRDGPHLGRRLASLQDVAALPPVEEVIAALSFQKEALLATRRLLPEDRSLIGFVGGPITLFSYAVFGRWLSERQQLEQLEPMLSAFLDRIGPLLVANMKLQLQGGAEMIMIFDTAAGQLSNQQFRKLLLPHLEKIAAALPGRSGYYARALKQEQLEHLLQIAGFAGLAIDHNYPLAPLLKQRQWAKARQDLQWNPSTPLSRPKRRGFLQGNFDQNLLLLPKEELKSALLRFLQPIQALTAQERRGWICSLGHGVIATTPEENVRLFVETVREAFGKQ